MVVSILRPSLPEEEEEGGTLRKRAILQDSLEGDRKREEARHVPRLYGPSSLVSSERRGKKASTVLLVLCARNVCSLHVSLSCSSILSFCPPPPPPMELFHEPADFCSSSILWRALVSAFRIFSALYVTDNEGRGQRGFLLLNPPSHSVDHLKPSASFFLLLLLLFLELS